MWDSGSTHSGKFFGPGSGFLRITFLLLRGTFVVQRGIEGLWSVVRASDSTRVQTPIRCPEVSSRGTFAAAGSNGKDSMAQALRKPIGQYSLPQAGLATRPDRSIRGDARRPCIPAARSARDTFSSSLRRGRAGISTIPRQLPALLSRCSLLRLLLPGRCVMAVASPPAIARRVSIQRVLHQINTVLVLHKIRRE